MNPKNLPKCTSFTFLDMLVLPTVVVCMYCTWQMVGADESPLQAAAYYALTMLASMLLSIIVEVKDCRFYRFTNSQQMLLLMGAALEVVALYAAIFVILRWFFLFEVNVDNVMLFAMMSCSFIVYGRFDNALKVSSFKMHVNIRNINMQLKHLVESTGEFKAPVVTYYKNWLFPIKLVYDDKQKVYVIKA